MTPDRVAKHSAKHIRQELAATLATEGGTPGTGAPWPWTATARKEHYEEVVRLIEELVDLKVREHCEDRNHRHSA